MADDSAYLTAMTTEHFALQSSAASTISEASSRTSTYLLCVSSSLVAFGFTAGLDHVFPYILGAVIPVLFVLGWFTIGRLVDTTIENLGYQTRMLHIYEYYATLAPDGKHNFPVGPSVPNEAQTKFLIVHRFPMLLTMASMVGAVNGVLAGAGVAYAVATLTGAPVPLAIAVGIVVAVGCFFWVLLYQRHRFTTADVVFDSSATNQGPARRHPAV